MVYIFIVYMYVFVVLNIPIFSYFSCFQPPADNSLKSMFEILGDNLVVGKVVESQYFPQKQSSSCKFYFDAL